MAKFFVDRTTTMKGGEWWGVFEELGESRVQRAKFKNVKDALAAASVLNLRAAQQANA